MPDREAVLRAADRLDDLSGELALIIEAMRFSPDSGPAVYAAVYEFRAEIGKVVAKLGEGAPVKRRNIN